MYCGVDTTGVSVVYALLPVGKVVDLKLQENPPLFFIFFKVILSIRDFRQLFFPILSLLLFSCHIL